jgi:hypothetical protein
LNSRAGQGHGYFIAISNPGRLHPPGITSRADRLAAVLIYRGEGTVRHDFASAAQIAAPRYQANLRAQMRMAAPTSTFVERHEV